MDYEVLVKNSFNSVKDNLVAFVVGFIITIFGSILIVTIAPLAYGLTSMAVKGARGEKVEVSDLFVGFNLDDAIRSWVFMIIYLIVIIIAAEIASILSTVIGILFMFALPLLVIKEYSAIDAIKESIDIVKENPVESLVIYVIVAVLNVIGIFLLLIGMLLTAPIGMVLLAGSTLELAE